MNLLNKLKNVKIDILDMISKEDLDFCKTKQEEYEQAIQYATEFITETNKFIGEYRNNELFKWRIKDYELKNMANGMVNIDSRFYQDIIDYFSKKYTVDLSKIIIPEKVNYHNRDSLDFTSNYTYEDVLKDISIILNGKSFKEIATEQLKTELYKKFGYQYPVNRYHNGEYKTTLKKDKVSIIDVFTWTGYGNTYNEYTELIYNGLNAYKDCFNPFIKDWGMEWYKIENYMVNIDEELKDHELLKSIKFYKNGKIDLVFKNADDAKTFAREWIGIEC